MKTKKSFLKVIIYLFVFFNCIYIIFPIVTQATTEENITLINENKEAEVMYILNNDIMNIDKVKTYKSTEPSLGEVKMYVGESATHLSYPRMGFYCNYDNTLIAIGYMYEYGYVYGGDADNDEVAQGISADYYGNND